MQQSLSYEFSQPIALANESDALSSLCTIQSRIGGPTPVVDALGQVDVSDVVNVPGLVNIPCMIAPYRPSSPDKGAEMRMPVSIDTSNYRHVLLNAYYPQILQQYRAVIDGIPYDIFAVESDSQKTMTRLVVRIYQQ